MKDSKKAHRKPLVQGAERAIDADSHAALQEIIASFAGQSYEELEKRVGSSVYSRDVPRNGRDYRVLFDVSRDTGPLGDHLLLNFQVDDGGRYMLPPVTRWFAVFPGETFTP